MTFPIFQLKVKAMTNKRQLILSDVAPRGKHCFSNNQTIFSFQSESMFNQSLRFFINSSLQSITELNLYDKPLPPLRVASGLTGLASMVLVVGLAVNWRLRAMINKNSSLGPSSSELIGQCSQFLIMGIVHINMAFLM